LETTELLKKVRKIEIKTRGLTNQIFSGEYHSAFKGRGMAFSEVREYQPGDDIRSIDWNVTARFNHPYVKIFEEERELTVMLLVDVSASEIFGTSQQLKKEVIVELCAVLSFAAMQNNDKIGIIFFTDRVEKFIPPKKGKSHILRIIRELLNFEPVHKQTRIKEGVKFFTNAIKKRSIAFILSDFIDKDFEHELKLASKKHDVVALHVFDKREREMPAVGLVRFIDPETGEQGWVDTSDWRVRHDYYNEWIKHLDMLKNTFSKSGIDWVSISTDESYIKPLMNFFRRREKKR
jgi:uncharacterized protein (DUF58 family)